MGVHVACRVAPPRSYYFHHRNSLDLGIKLLARGLTTVQDSTSQKFILLGQLSRRSAGSQGRTVTVFLDFAATRNHKCGDSDFERWNARTVKGKECLMGHKVGLVLSKCVRGDL